MTSELVNYETLCQLPTDFNDKTQKSRRKGDLTVTGLFDEGKTILDIGITHPTIDSSINTLSSEERAASANRYANNNDASVTT